MFKSFIPCCKVRKVSLFGNINTNKYDFYKMDWTQTKHYAIQTQRKTSWHFEELTAVWQKIANSNIF